MRAATRTLQRIAARLSPEQVAALQELERLRQLIDATPSDPACSVVVGIWTALRAFARRGPRQAADAIREARDFVAVLRGEP